MDDSFNTQTVKPGETEPRNNQGNNMPRLESADDMIPGEGSFGKPQVSPGGRSGKLKWLILVVLLLLVGAAAAWFVMNKKDETGDKKTASSNGKTKLVIMSHWLEDPQINGIKDASGKVTSKGFQAYLDEYESLNKNVEIELRQVHFNDYPDRLRVLATSGVAPDIYGIYAPWGAEYVRAGILAAPPADVIDDVKKNYVSSAGPTIEGKIWGYPSEINNYALLYNKNLYKQAGIVDASGNAKAPTTWQEVADNAKKLTKHDKDDNITQYGIAFTKDAEWQVADPFLSLLFSNGGQYLASDLSKATFNSDAGVAALDAQVQLFKDNSTDLTGNFFDFGKGTVAQVIAPPWTKGGFAKDFGANFESTVGVAPFPGMKGAGTLQYSWFSGVMQDSKNKEEAWKFLTWLNTETQPDSGTTRMGDLLANTIGAIPARTVDFEKHESALGDFFTSVYVKQMKDSTAEPNVLQSDQLKEKLITEIQAVWAGEKTSKQGLDAAAVEINKILDLFY
jgi:multiple sugar transport system substrate-binding protein